MASISYIVRPGDTLTKIAKQHGLSTWQDVYNYSENAAFRAKRPNPDEIYPGDVIKIPRLATFTTAAVSTEQGLAFEEVLVPSIPGTMTGTGPNRHGVKIARSGSVERDVHNKLPGGPLEFVMAPANYTSYALLCKGQTTPGWYGVAVPKRGLSFKNVNLFFHPSDKKLANTGIDPRFEPWNIVFRYVGILGAQLSAANTDQILVMPFIPPDLQTDPGLGSLCEKWKEIIDSIISHIYNKEGREGGVAPSLQRLIVSSFSYGITVSEKFVNSGGLVRKYLRERWDFDGQHSDDALAAKIGMQHNVVQYDQRPITHYLPQYHEPGERWRKEFGKLSDKEVHGKIPAHLFYHAANRSAVGAWTSPTAT